MAGNNLLLRYLQILRGYLADRTEANLYEAYELSRECAKRQIGPEQITSAHIQALEVLLDERGLSQEELLASNALLMETMMAYTLAYRESLELERQLDKEREARKEEERVRNAYASVISAVTDGKLILVSPDELESSFFPFTIKNMKLVVPVDVSRARETVAAVTEKLGFDPDRAHGLLLALSEAATNALVHGEGGRVILRRNSHGIQVVVSDRGPGINFSLLPKAALVNGFSTKPSLGAGFTFMLEFCDRVLLCTGPTGTTIALEVKKESAAGQTAKSLPLEDLLYAS